MKIEYKEFPTHAVRRSRKTMADKMVKINNNSIYNSSVARYDRNTVMDYLHSYLMLGGDKVLRKLKIPYSSFFIMLKFYVPKNYGTVSLRNGKLSWKPVTAKYKGRWDVGNYGDIWNKAFEDALQLAGVIEDDDVCTVLGHGVMFVPVDDLADRKLVFEFWEEDML